MSTKTGKWTDYNVRVSIVPTKTGKWTVITMLGYRLCLPRQGSGERLLVKGIDCASDFTTLFRDVDIFVFLLI